MRSSGLAVLPIWYTDQAEAACEVFTELGLRQRIVADNGVWTLREQGFDASIVDEAYTRVIHLPDPDGGPAWQINHRQTDLYGFRLNR